MILMLNERREDMNNLHGLLSNPPGEKALNGACYEGCEVGKRNRLAKGKLNLCVLADYIEIAWCVRRVLAVTHHVRNFRRPGRAAA
jgi:hypothetical protein